MNFKQFYFLEREDLERAKEVKIFVEKVRKWISFASYKNGSLKLIEEDLFFTYGGVYRDCFNTYKIDVGILDPEYKGLFLKFKSEIDGREVGALASYTNIKEQINKIPISLLQNFIGVEYEITFYILNNSFVEWDGYKIWDEITRIGWGTVAHEVNHYLDDIKFKFSIIKNKKITTTELQNKSLRLKKYYDSGTEKNSHWNQALYQIQEFLLNCEKENKIALKKYLTNFIAFQKIFIEHFLKFEYKEHLRKNNSKGLKKLISRLYLVWQEFQKEFKIEL